jgi:hypothetical protein
MRCELEEDHIGNFPGVTLFTKGTAHCIKPTAVYLPPNPAARGNMLDVVIWLHGFAVRDHKFLFRNDPARIREQVRDSNKNVVLIAPFLGYEYSVGNGFAGNYNVKDLATRNWGERYLNEVLAAISHFQVPDLKSPPQLQINKLVIACHSAGGNGMRNLVGSLGRYQSNLKACWGFDCLYDGSGPPDHATFWYRWLSGPKARPLDIIYGPDTLPQSVKLDLMARGLATPEGNKAEPRRPALKNLNVSIGHYDAFPAFGQMVKVNDLDPSFVDRFMIPPAADGAPSMHKPWPQGKFLQQAIANVREAFPFPKDIHYMIARGGFLDRLSKF